MNKKLAKAERKVSEHRRAFRKNIIGAIVSGVLLALSASPVIETYDRPITPMILVDMLLCGVFVFTTGLLVVTALANRDKVRKYQRRRDWLHEVETLDRQYRES